VFEEARYGLGFSYLAMGQPHHTVVVLDQLVAASPAFTRARYLLGVALVRMGSETGVRRGCEVLAQLAKEAPAPDGPAAMRAMSRYELDLAAGLASAGQPFAAEAALEDVQERFGPASGANDAENQALLFAMGVIHMQAGNASAGLADHESLKSHNAGYRLKDGVTLKQVLSDAYYQAGLEQLHHRGDAALQQAVAYFDRAEANGTGKEVDTHHGKAIAYKRMKQPDKMALELGAVLKLNPEYFKKINTGS
jgi:tetratricopeptide (TPR) repeat protein